MARKTVKIELTKDWQGFKKGTVLDRSKNIASIHCNDLKNAKPFVKKTTKKVTTK